MPQLASLLRSVRLLAYSLAFCRANQLASVLEPLANESALWQFSLVEPLLIDWSRPYVAHTSQQKERIARVTRKRLCNQTNTFSHRANLIRVHHNSELERIDGFEKLKTLGADDDTEPALVVVENGDRGITMNAFGTLERGGWAALQRLDASALCASALVAQDEAPCYCGDAADDCFEHPDVIRELTKYVDEDDDDDEDDVEAIAPAPRQAPPAGWGKLLSA